MVNASQQARKKIREILKDKDTVVVELSRVIKDAGSLEVGKFADFVVLDKNPLKVDPDEIRNIHVIATVRGGLITYSDVPKYDRNEPPGAK